MRRSFCWFAILVTLTFPAAAQQGKGKGKGKGGGNGRNAQVRVFRSTDRTIIVDYYRMQPGGLPPGLARREGLPPGLEKQLRRNGRLPPGLEKRLVAFPPALEARLPPCPPDLRRGLIGGVAVMWSPRTGLIVDAAAVFGR